MTTYVYDAAGNLVSETAPLGGRVSYEYDADNTLIKRTDADGKVTSFARDALHRETGRTDADGASSFAYDEIGNLTQVTDPTGTVSFSFDALSRATKVIDAAGNETGYQYDAAGNRTQITYPDGTVVSTTYDTLGLPQSLTDRSDNTGVTYNRDHEGRLTKETHTDGSTTEYDYNGAGRLTMLREVTGDNESRREITYAYDDAGNLLSENRRKVGADIRDEIVRYTYDKANRLLKTTTEGKLSEQNTYDLAGNLLSDGEFTYAYDLQNRLITKTGKDGVTRYEYDKSGNLTRQTAPTGVSTYTYTAQNKLQKGENAKGETSEYTYNALGVRVKNVQVRHNWNNGHMNILPDNGSIYLHDYLPALSDNRELWQPTWETEVGTTVQNDYETVTKNYVTDYLSLANRDIMVENEGQYVQRYVYGVDGARLSVQVTYADGTQRGQSGENLASDIAANDVEKVWYRHSLLDSTLLAVDENGEQIVHMSYDAWGVPQTETKLDANFSGLDNLNNFTGYTYDEVLELYFAQNRFYDAQTHRFTQQDPVKDGANWYVYCGNNPTVRVDEFGLYYIKYAHDATRAGTGWYYYPVKQNMVTAAAIAAANLLPFGLGDELIIGQQDKDGIFGGSSFIERKDFQQKLKDLAASEGPDMLKNALKKSAPKLASALGKVSTAITVVGIAKDINTYGSIAIMDNLVFKLMDLSNVVIREPTASLVVYRMDLAYEFVTTYSDYFFASPWPDSSSIFDMQYEIYKLSDSKKKNKIDTYAKKYYAVLTCGDYLVTYNNSPVLSKSDPILKTIRDNFKTSYLDNADAWIKDIAAAFKEHVNTPLGGYDAQFSSGK